MLDLLGRHPLMTIQQIADLLALTACRTRQLRQSLVEQGLVRVLNNSELGQHPRVEVAKGCSAVLDVAELTAAGRRRLAGSIGLPVSAARRHQGLSGGSPRHRHLALRNLAHTVGANDVFVAISRAARAATAWGADEALGEWRPAAACERGRCKPDGYGCYRRGGTRYGFLLEFDRGTERANQYAAKLAAYYGYRNSGQAARDYAGFPDVLFVTTSSAAETRILAAAERAYARFAGRPLPVFTTTTERILSTAYEIRGPIWRSPARGALYDHWIPCAVPQPRAAAQLC
jgi:hypothetical protein